MNRSLLANLAALATDLSAGMGFVAKRSVVVETARGHKHLGDGSYNPKSSVSLGASSE